VAVIYVVGKSTGTVWAIRENPYGTYSQLGVPVIVLENSGMTTIDDFVVGNFDRTDGADEGDDICLINYQTGQMQVHLYRGEQLDPVPMSDVHPTKGSLCTFSGNGSFLRSTVGDFDGDGNDDILLMAPATGNNVVWLSDGTAIVDRYPWCIGGSINAHPLGVDYDGDGKTDLILINVIGGAFSAWRSDGAHFTRECVRTFTAGAFSYAVKGDFIINEEDWTSESDKEEFALHAPLGSGFLVIFEYLPDYPEDPAPFKSRSSWGTSSDSIL
jgi:hypothetical protein